MTQENRPPSTEEILDRLAQTRPPQPAAAPLAEVFPIQSRFNTERLVDLEAAVRQPISVPYVGEAAASALMLCFDTVAKDVVKVAQEHVDRALRQLEEAKNFAGSIHTTGQLMCDRIRSETIRGAKVSEVLRIAGQVINEPMSTDHVEKPEEGGEQPQGTAAATA